MADQEPNSGEESWRRADLITGAQMLPIIPRNIEEMYRMAKWIYEAGIAPESYTHKRLRGGGLEAYSEKQAVGRIIMGIQKGLEVGFPPLTALEDIAIINNKACVYGRGGVALLQRGGHLEDMTEEEIGPSPGHEIGVAGFHSDFGIRITMKRKGQSTPYIGQFTVGDAIRAGLWMSGGATSPWIKHPKQQLWFRSWWRCAGRGFADDLKGMGIVEIMDEVPLEAPSTPTGFFSSPRRHNGELPAPSTEPATEPAGARDVEEAQSPAEAEDTPQAATGAQQEVPAAEQRTRRRRRTKAEMEEARQRAAQQPAEPIPMPPPQPQPIPQPLPPEPTPPEPEPAPLAADGEPDEETWWDLAARSNMWTVGLKRQAVATDLKTMIDIISEAPSTEALEIFATANTRNIATIRHANRAAGDQIEDAIGDKRAELKEAGL